MRLDKFLAGAGLGTRSEVKDMIRAGRVTVNSVTVKDGGMNVTDSDDIRLKGSERPLTNRNGRIHWFMLNKPAGIVSANSDMSDDTVIGLFAGEGIKDLFTVGRLDKDTEGLLLVTNDGELSHFLLSPGRHVPKTYHAVINGILADDAAEKLKNGIAFKDFTSAPAELVITATDREKCTCEADITVSEGKFHEVKRLIAAVGGEVTYLKRISFGPLMLDGSLKPGEYRILSNEEIRSLAEAVGKGKKE